MNKRLVTIITLLITNIMMAGTSFGTENLTALSPISAVSGPAGTGFPVGKLAMLLNYRYIETDGIRYQNDEVNNVVELTKNIGIVKFRYGILPGLDVRTATPFYNIEKQNNVAGSTDDLGWAGDTTVLFHKVVMNQKNGGLFNLAFDLGGTLPTANSGDDRIDFIGNRAWGGFFGVGLTKVYKSHRFDQEFNFATFTEGDGEYRKPNRFRCNTTWAYALNPRFDFGVESNFEWNGESEKNDISQDDARKEWYAGPKVAFKYKPFGFLTGAAALFPVYRHYDAKTPSDGFRFELKLIKVL